MVYYKYQGLLNNFISKFIVRHQFPFDKYAFFLLLKIIRLCICCSSTFINMDKIHQLNHSSYIMVIVAMTVLHTCEVDYMYQMKWNGKFVTYGKCCEDHLLILLKLTSASTTSHITNKSSQNSSAFACLY